MCSFGPGRYCDSNLTNATYVMCCEDSRGSPHDVLQVCAVDLVRCSTLGTLTGVTFRAHGAKTWPASLLAFEYSVVSFCGFISFLYSLYNTWQSGLLGTTVLPLTRQSAQRLWF